MYPGMTFAILCRDPDFVQDVAVLLRNAGAGGFGIPPPSCLLQGGRSLKQEP